jgi:plasmid stabilization system protein ParE
MVERITSAVLQLESFPELGARIVGWGREDLREIIVGNYRVIYRLTAKTVYIVTVIHAARSYPSDAN